VGGTKAYRRSEEEAVSEGHNELLEGWVGKPVVVSQLAPPDWGEDRDEENESMAKMASDPNYTRVQALRSVRSACELAGYDRLGVTLRMLSPDRTALFVPWGAVIMIEPGFEEHEALLS
jgi:hypothetical protein